MDLLQLGMVPGQTSAGPKKNYVTAKHVME